VDSFETKKFFVFHKSESRFSRFFFLFSLKIYPSLNINKPLKKIYVAAISFGFSGVELVSLYMLSVISI